MRELLMVMAMYALASLLIVRIVIWPVLRKEAKRFQYRANQGNDANIMSNLP